MKTPKLPPPSDPSYSLPDGYFEQFSDRLNHRIEMLENWKSQSQKEPEAIWPVSPGVWLKMEEGIRARIQTGPSKMWNLTFPTWAMASTAIILLAIGVWYNFPFANQQQQDWNQIISQSSEIECAAYLEEDDDWIKSGVETIPDVALESVLPESIPLDENLLENVEWEDLSN